MDSARDIVCRPATPADVPAIAAVRIRSWQEAYRGVIPQDYLDSLSVAAEVERREGRSLDGQHVAEANGAVVGWLYLGPYRADEGEEPPGPSAGEVGAIYTVPEVWGRGVGRRLLAYGLGELRRLGLSPVLLWVLVANERARRFYERAGFRADGPVVGFEVGGTTLPEMRYRYDG
jgi:ribosomal protein S18 acetylase RimI-like enzyme